MSTRPTAPPRSGSNNYLNALASAQAQDPSLTTTAPRPSALSSAPPRNASSPSESDTQSQTPATTASVPTSDSNSSASAPPKTPTASTPTLSSLPPHTMAPPTTGTGAPPPTPVAGTGQARTSPFGETGTRVVQSGPGKEDVGEGKSWDEQDMKRVVQRRLLNVEKGREAGFSSVGGEGGRNP